MITKEKIGKIQFYLGILLLLVTIVGSIFIIKNVYIGNLVKGVGKSTDAWTEVTKEINGTNIGIMGHISSNIALQGTLFANTAILFITCVLILITLSMMMILQGLANQSKK